jgi:hypothetical protein
MIIYRENFRGEPVDGGAWGRDEKRGAWQNHRRLAWLRINSSCTSVDHLLTRQERRDFNYKKISTLVNI